MSLSALLPLILMQVGPNPSADLPPAIPPELRELRRRNAAREAEADRTVRSEGSRYAECLSLSRSDPIAAQAMAQTWLASSEGGAAARAGHCLGMALVELDYFADGAQAFADARALVPASAAQFRAMLGALEGNAALAGGDAERALRAFDGALVDALAALDAQLMGETHIDRARALVALGRNQEAADALANAREITPGNATAWLLSATLSRRLGKLPAAQQQIERAAMLAPRDPAIGLEAGVIAAQSGRFDVARRSFQSVVDVAPESAQAATAQTYLRQLDEGSAPQPG